MVGVPTAPTALAIPTGRSSELDVDSAATFVAQSGAARTYGTFSIDATGAWSYTLDDGNSAVQALNAGGTLHELVTVATADGTTRQIDVTINGANDAAVIAGPVPGSVIDKGGVANGTAALATAPRTLSPIAAYSAVTFLAESRAASTYPTRRSSDLGAWSYTLDDGNSAVQALNAGGTLHELVTVATADGTTRQIDVTING